MPNFLNAPHWPLLSSNSAHSGSQEFTADSTKQKIGPRIYKNHRKLAPNKLQFETSDISCVSSCQLPKVNEPINRTAEARPLNLPQIDVLKGRDDFALSSVQSLKSDWYVTTVNQTIGGSKIVVRKRNCETVCMERNSALEAVKLRRKRAWARNIWQRAIQKVISDRRKMKKKILYFWKDTAKKLLKLNYETREQLVEDRFKLLCAEFQRLMIPDDWKSIRQQDYDLDRMMKKIDHRHRQKVMDQLRNVIKEEEKSQVYEDLKKIAKKKQKRKQQKKALSRQSSAQTQSEAISSPNNISPEILLQSSAVETSVRRLNSPVQTEMEIEGSETK